MPSPTLQVHQDPLRDLSLLAPRGDANEIAPGIPGGQLNAHLLDGLQMRVGVPHRSGSLAAHAFENGYAAMISASAFWNPAGGVFRYQDYTDVHELDFALDSAGFTAMLNWKKKGTQAGIGGIYPWSYGQFVELASIYQPAWWAQPDACCEKEIAGSQAEIDQRVDATASMLEGTLRVLYDWQNKYAQQVRGDNRLTNDDASIGRMVTNQFKPCMPVLQGWSVDDYLRSLDMMMNVWQRWEPWLAPPALIGLGSVCRRNLHDPQFGLYAVLEALEGRLPIGSKLHLFGVKGECLSHVKNMDWIASADSMAYDFSARVNARRAGVSNTMELRAAEMTRWMTRAHKLMDSSEDLVSSHLEAEPTLFPHATAALSTRVQALPRRGQLITGASTPEAIAASVNDIRGMVARAIATNTELDELTAEEDSDDAMDVEPLNEPNTEAPRQRG